ncbi:hypothetical protein [Agrococcus jejuensis]|nr:hypothetical protein [Agrococcus jejuensis]
MPAAVLTEPQPPTPPSPAADAHELVWEVAEAGVWAAAEPGPRRAMHAGFVHHVGDRYLAVDGLGAGIGAFVDLVVAQSAVALAFRTTFVPSIWMREV